MKTIKMLRVLALSTLLLTAQTEVQASGITANQVTATLSSAASWCATHVKSITIGAYCGFLAYRNYTPIKNALIKSFTNKSQVNHSRKKFLNPLDTIDEVDEDDLGIAQPVVPKAPAKKETGLKIHYKRETIEQERILNFCKENNCTLKDLKARVVLSTQSILEKASEEKFTTPFFVYNNLQSNSSHCAMDLYNQISGFFNRTNSEMKATCFLEIESPQKKTLTISVAQDCYFVFRFNEDPKNAVQPLEEQLQDSTKKLFS